jgi:Domain of unknown function (DUF5666)
MKVLFVVAVVALTSGGTTVWGSTNTPSTKTAAQQPRLVLVGPVEAIDEKDSTAVVLGQKLSVGHLDSIAVGDNVSVFGTLGADQSVAVSRVTDQGIYVAGASRILLTGVVQQVHESIGRAEVSGVNVDLTSIYAADGSSTLAVGSLVQVSGTQPASRGLVLADGIVGGGKSASGIVGGSMDGIVGGGKSTSGIVGGGKSTSGIVGGGKSTSGIVGGG